MAFQFNLFNLFVQKVLKLFSELYSPTIRSLTNKNHQFQILNCNSLKSIPFDGGEKIYHEKEYYISTSRVKNLFAMNKSKTVNLMSLFKPVKKNLKQLFTVVDIDPPRINKPFVKTQQILRISFFFSQWKVMRVCAYFNQEEILLFLSVYKSSKTFNYSSKYLSYRIKFSDDGTRNSENWLR